ncbi:replicative DNA helicase [Terricaulis silvestris]|uniref:Replicative DNA helicase n=1 Tax=Terricaulis silvestris TaxID=2686094 RepID=A0A6I6MSA1_9CAUL|nr:replicative DNA helicase [Terricaulis silvestris]QGZ95484.1 Replicative DNA helicase [Terricaulis silvestris]
MSNQQSLPLAVPAAPPQPRVAPHNLEAEQALLGAILFDNETYNRINSSLQEKHFYDPVHGRIFSACADLITAGQLADGVTLKERFSRDGGIKEIGGAVYLLKLMEAAAPLSAHAQSYADLIYDLALRRELIRVGNVISDLAESPPDDHDANDIIEEAERTLFGLAESGTTSRGFQDFKTAITKSIEVAAAAKNRGSDVSGISSGFRELDHKLGGFHGSDLIILAGRPSMGKTALALNMAMNAALAKLKGDQTKDESHAGGVVGFFSLEMSAEQLATRLLSDYTSIESHRLRQGRIEKHEFMQINDAAQMLHTLPLHVDETGGISIAQLHNRARRLKRTAGLDLIVVDYLQLVTTNSRKNDGRVQEVSAVTQGLKTLAKDLNVPVLALSQLSRQVESRDDKRPQLSDLRESGSIEQDADVVMFVYREEYYLSRTEPEPNSDKHIEWRRKMDAAMNKAELILGKNRHGPIDTVDLTFEGKFTRFSSAATQRQR